MGGAEASEISADRDNQRRKVRYRACEAEVGRDCEGRRTEWAGRGGGKSLPTVTIGDEKCVTEREGRKLDATVTVGGQRGGAESSEIPADLCRP